MDGGGGIGECFTLSGFIKILESCAAFTCVMLHRIGDQGNEAFFAASDQILHSQDATYETEVDAEIIGVGTITAFTIISPMLLLAYSLYGRKAVQGTHLDILFCAVGAILFLTSGGMTLFAWRMNSNLTTNQANNASLGRRDFEAAGALGVLCICTGILFIADFFYVMYQNVLHAPEVY